MADAICAELMRGMKEKAEWLASIVWRKADRPAKKCPKCGNVNYGRVSIDNCCGIFSACAIFSYCPACKTLHQSEDIAFE